MKMEIFKFLGGNKYLGIGKLEVINYLIKFVLKYDDVKFLKGKKDIFKVISVGIRIFDIIFR